MLKNEYIKYFSEQQHIIHKKIEPITGDLKSNINNIIANDQTTEDEIDNFLSVMMTIVNSANNDKKTISKELVKIYADDADEIFDLLFIKVRQVADILLKKIDNDLHMLESQLNVTGIELNDSIKFANKQQFDEIEDVKTKLSDIENVLKNYFDKDTNISEKDKSVISIIDSSENKYFNINKNVIVADPILKIPTRTIKEKDDNDDDDGSDDDSDDGSDDGGGDGDEETKDDITAQYDDDDDDD